MTAIVFRTFYLFSIVIEYILIAYVISSWFPPNSKLRTLMHTITDPILDPIRFLLKHSVFYSQISDFSPLIAFVVVTYLQKFFLILSA